MKEQFLHFVWQYHRFNHRELQTTDQLPVHIVDYGQPNSNDGPDFLYAKVKIGDVLWVGHIEIHVQTSDWDKHQHTKDPQYKNVILHVVYRHDKEITHLKIPTLELTGLIPKSIYDRYLSLMESASILPCQHLIAGIDTSIIRMYMHRLAIERLESKVGKIENLLQQFNNDFEQVAFIWLSRYFGVGSNSESFQELATRVPIQWLSKIQHEQDGVTALLMGCAGFLKNISNEDTYLLNLLYQFEHYRNKWELQPLEPQWWKWKMGRPASFPTLKLAQLAKLLEEHRSIFQLILNEKDFIGAVTSISLNTFWDKHYLLQRTSISKEKGISLDFAQRLVINISVPMMIAYGRYTDDHIWTEKALDILGSLPAEKNKVTKTMQESGLENQHALDSQGLLQLKNEYCDQKRCLNCQIGNKIIQPPSYQIREPFVYEEYREAYV